jgi:hypothetical protein
MVLSGPGTVREYRMPEIRSQELLPFMTEYVWISYYMALKLYRGAEYPKNRARKLAPPIMEYVSIWYSLALKLYAIAKSPGSSTKIDSSGCGVCIRMVFYDSQTVCGYGMPENRAQKSTPLVAGYVSLWYSMARRLYASTGRAKIERRDRALWSRMMYRYGILWLSDCIWWGIRENRGRKWPLSIRGYVLLWYSMALARCGDRGTCAVIVEYGLIVVHQ